MKLMHFGLMVFLLSIYFMGCTKTTEEQIQEYMEFYYPTSGEFTYNVVFDWGEYEIFTGAKIDEQVHPDSEPFKGFITFRPYVTDAALTPAMPVYLITPDGEVWKTIQGSSIAENNTRKEVTEEKTDFGTSSQTRTINSSSEPVILSFKNDKGIWEKYGTLTAGDNKSSFTPAKKY
jgi:hypothetical protein